MIWVVKMLMIVWVVFDKSLLWRHMSVISWFVVWGRVETWSVLWVIIRFETVGMYR